ncbi:glycosyltransferase family 2 protein [Patescibacteria group bacterium]|nr:glycosyltransferase family 2 protein [Patescibacteria group bacterium]
MEKVKELSVFFPAYNEEDNIKTTVTKAIKILPKVAKKWEIIVIDDGSTDKTGEIVEELIKKEPRIKMITHTPNRGYGATIKSGVYNARYELIAFTDADGQFDFSEITKFIKEQHQSKADLVIGYYLKRAEPFYRILISKILWELPVFLLFGLRARDIDCGFKLISKKVIDKIPRLEAERGPFITTELLVKAKKEGFKISQVGVHHYPRKAGQATGITLKVALSGYVDLLRFYRKLKKR